MYKIDHDRNLNTVAGYVDIVENQVPPIALATRPMQPKDANTLLHFLFWVAYSWEGRQTCREYKAGRAGAARTTPEDRPLLHGANDDAYYPDEKIREELGAIFAARIGEANGPLLDALLRAHISAGYWVTLDQKSTQTPDDLRDREHHRGAYQHAMSFVNWRLWEDFQVHEFSLAW